MQMKIRGQRINVVNLIFCGAGVVLFIAIGVLPAQHRLGELDQAIERLNIEIENQKLLYPVFAELFTRSREKLPAALAAPEPKKLPKGDTAALVKSFREIADRNRVVVSTLAPDVESLFNDTGRLKINAELVVPFPNLREFLIQIGQIPYIDSFEHIRVQAAELDQPLTLSLRFWVLQS